jgi:hypothetical protein
MKNTSRRGVLTLAIEFWIFRSPEGLRSLEGLPSPHFGNVNVILTLLQSGVATLSFHLLFITRKHNLFDYKKKKKTPFAPLFNLIKMFFWTINLYLFILIVMFFLPWDHGMFWVVKMTSYFTIISLCKHHVSLLVNIIHYYNL